MMQYTGVCQTPLGEVLLAGDGQGLTGLWFKGGKYYALGLSPEREERETAVFDQTRRWLDIYFSGRKPDFMPPIHLTGTPFQLAVWELLRRIPYGQTLTYGELAARIAAERGLSHMSAQAVGGAVGHNPISLIVPCHRVVGADGSLTGYAGGVAKKERLLALEGVDMGKLFLPAKGTAL
jgi:methylated-DNA-[protein]-cysteine S-methyltransferase